MTAVETKIDKLDATQPQNVQYAVPLWLRDEQIKIALQRISKRLEPHAERPDARVAVACFGPSLSETWEELRNFDFIISCSGAHKFLIDRGIVPTWHIEVDPRAHKIQLIGAPHPDVEYLIASTCHPAVFEHLDGMNVKLWHVFDGEQDALRTLPHGEWAITGGCSVGLRAMGIAAFLGFRDVHVFGMDGSEGKTGKHAAEHPNQPKGHSITEYNGVEYRTTPAMLEAARQTFHELDQLPGVKIKFYGEGLVQAMARDYKPNPNMVLPFLQNVVGFVKPPLISEPYRELNERLHRENLAYGVGGGRHAPVVLKLAESVNARSILDYGCGKGGLAKALPFGICEYDPCVPGKTESPKPADLVVCTDVLEHIEPEKLLFVLDDLRRVVLKVGYFVVHTGAAMKTLADGTNAHRIQKGRDWWKKHLKKFFDVGQIAESGPELHIVVAPKAKTK
jgi:uncharacterized Rossmann fold enzyme